MLGYQMPDKTLKTYTEIIKTQYEKFLCDIFMCDPVLHDLCLSVFLRGSLHPSS